ncbi:hypothetical protein [Chondromyces crocatus]|uniref:SRCR domain-containing protein n=1 Tax=Chondromyces crocatus TaxID=52 RepID=A0A0K1EE14_CHOCO|nr:hypothetical protein [Chondromyces crocatus]AKT39105.1 uncharacterized protein CMC5_032520 [Chondromyces crocatus]
MARSRRQARLGASGLTLATTLLVSCAQLTGLDGFEVGSGSSGTTVGSGGMGPSSGEDCTDGLDNDDDGLIDCADVEDCAPTDHVCVPATPPGWTGDVRVAIVDHAAADTLPPCPAGTETFDYFAGPAIEAECTPCDGCTWDRATAACFAPTLACHSSGNGNTTCNGNPTSERADRLGGTCESLTSSIPNSASCRLTQPATLRTRGTCDAAPDGGQLQTSPWSQVTRVCIGAPRLGGHCDDGGQCLPRSNDDAAFEGWACVLQPGYDACPAGWTDLERQLFETGVDTRTCAPCGCDLDALGCTGGGFLAYDLAGCSGTYVTIDSTQCVDITPLLGQNFAFRTEAATVTGDVTCTGGEGSGAVIPEGPAKLCCLSMGRASD